MDKKIFKILSILKKALQKKYSNDFSNLLLFGSQMNSYNPESDCDIMIIFKKTKDWKEVREVMDLVLDIGIENDIVFNTKIYSESQLKKPVYREVPFIKNVLNSGMKV
ncbi:MAG: nucleotidyltransferase domain-containing protein [Actinomycetota bacterium]